MERIPAELAAKYLEAGLSVLPADRARKRPSVGGWKTYAERLPTSVEVSAWFANAHDALCVVAGAVSGGLECIDFDAHGELFPKWREAVPDELFARLVVERTPSGGRHVLYRTEGAVGGNRKLAQGLRGGRLTTLVETRGEGGLFLCAPSEGYELVQGDPARVEAIPQEARRRLLEAAEALDERVPAAAPADAPQGGNSAFLVKPGDDWCARGDIRPVLEAHGWRSLGTRPDGNEHWQRPGKAGDGNSATFNGSVFCVFSTNAAPFEAKGYSKFQVYALLEHGGDFTAAARELLARGYGRAEDPCAGVDLSGILAQAAGGAAEPAEEPGSRGLEYEDPGPMDDSLYEVPGFVSELMEYTLRTAYYPNRALAFAGALAMLSHLTGRRYRDQRGGRFNIYLLALADSGVGKEHPRTVNIDLAAQTGFVGELGDTFASGEGLEDAMSASPAMLYQVDEIDYLFNVVKLKDSRAEQISSMLLKLYSESKTTHIMRKKALQRGQPQGPVSIAQPHLSMFGTATPKFFYQSLTERTMENGLLARCLVLEAGPRGAAGDPHEEEFPEMVLETVAELVRLGRERNLEGVYPHPVVLLETPEATERLKEVRLLADAEYEKAGGRGQDAARALWARAGEKVSKLAALHAVSANPKAPEMGAASVDWAWRFVSHATRRMLYMAGMFVSETDFDVLAKKVVRAVEAKGRISHARLLRNMHVNRDVFRQTVDTLVESGTLRREAGAKGGVFYVLD